MKQRFTHESKTGRGRIRKQIRADVFDRDENQCQFCFKIFDPADLTVDHLVPLASGGLDEITNYVSCCFLCNQEKADKPLDVFAASIGIDIEDLPVHGDPVIDNKDLPIAIRLVRKRVFDRSRKGEKVIVGKSAQKKIEKSYRREFWETDEGIELQKEFPLLPGQVRVMIPEFQTIAASRVEFLLLVELAKSAITRNLIGSIITKDKEVLKIVNSMRHKSNDEKLQKRVQQAWTRFEKELRSRRINVPKIT